MISTITCIDSPCMYISYISVLSSITKDKHVKKLWVLCTDSDVMFTSVDKFLTQMDKSYGDYVKHKSDISPSLGMLNY